VKPTGESFDDLGRGEGERGGNLRRVDGEAAQSSIDVIRHLSSTGYLRKRLPQELVLLQGGAGVAGDLALDGSLSGLALRGEVSVASVVAIDARAKARMQGYEGDPCGECGNFTLVRNGTCMKCNTCGGTSGCS
jgi:ribonucleoside-diphosphate reductase alpha chain